MTSPSDLNKVFEIILELPGITVKRSNANRTLGGESQEIR